MLFLPHITKMKRRKNKTKQWFMHVKYLGQNFAFYHKLK